MHFPQPHIHLTYLGDLTRCVTLWCFSHIPFIISDSAKLRLVNGSHQCSGRVEVLFLLEYGTVCDDGWDLKEATVVCRNLDCGSAVFAARRAQFGQGSGLIWQDDVECTGNESSLSECQSKPVGSHNCHPEQDAGVVCSGNQS